MRTRVYVDGFSLFFGALSKSHLKWLDLYALFQSNALNEEAVVEQVRFYTARIRPSSSDDQESPQRQQLYLKALQAHRGELVQIIEGKMQKSVALFRLAEDLPDLPKGTVVKVLKFSEKRTDVNLASDLISDAWAGRIDQAVVCSDDSDLAGALETVRRDCPGVRVGLVCPRVKGEQRMSHDLRRHTDWQKFLSVKHLEAAQLPEKIRGTSYTRPSAWGKS